MQDGPKPFHKEDVVLGNVYRVKLRGRFTDVRIDSVNRLGGWNATNLATGREVRIRSAAKLRREVTG